MKQKEFSFDSMTAKDVAERLRLLNELNNYINAVVLTTARMYGCGLDDRVHLNRDGTGIVVTSQEVEEQEMQWGAEESETKPGVALRTAGEHK